MQDLLSIGTNRRESMIGTGIGLGLAGYRLRTSFEAMPSLDLQFADRRMIQAVLGPTPSFSRASTGTYFDSQGVLKSAAVNGPRFNHVYNGTSWVSRGLLVEEQRTNNVLRSNEFNTTWISLDGSVVANSGTSPDGTNNAWKLNELATSTVAHGIYQTLTIPGGSCTWSIFAKAGERSWLQFYAYNSNANFSTWFNLSNGTIGTNAAGNTATITPVGNGWYRCSLTRSAGSDYAQIYTANGDNNSSYLGEAGKGIYIYGCQVESGAFPTSYIPTTSAATTRSADVCQITGSDFSGFWNGTEGSVVAEYDYQGAISGGPLRLAEAPPGNQSIGLESSSGNLNCYVYNSTSGGYQALFSASPLTGSTNKTAFGFAANNFAASFNGASALTDNAGVMPTGVIAAYISLPGTITLNGHIARLRYYPVRLSNSKLQELST